MFHWNCRENLPIQATLCISRGHRGTEFMNWRQQSRNRINQGVSTIFRNPGYLQGKDFPGGMGWEWGIKSMLWKGENSHLIKKESGSQIWKPDAYRVCTLHAAGRGVANGKKDFVLFRGLSTQKAIACTSIRYSMLSLSSLSSVSDFTWRGNC